MPFLADGSTLSFDQSTRVDGLWEYARAMSPEARRSQTVRMIPAVAGHSRKFSATWEEVHRLQPGHELNSTNVIAFSRLLARDLSIGMPFRDVFIFDPQFYCSEGPGSLRHVPAAPRRLPPLSAR